MSINTINTVDLEDLSDLNITPRHGVVTEKFDPRDATKSIISKKVDKTVAQIEQIKSSLSRIFLFENLESKEIDELIDFMFHKIVKKNEVVIAENEPGDNFYVIEKGTYHVYKGNKLLKTYENSGYFGELALLYNTPRNATVTATTDGILWGLDRNSFQRNVLQHAFENRQKSEQLIKMIEIFKTLPSDTSMVVADSIKFHSSSNEILFHEGDKNEKVYFIENGDVQLIKSINGKEVVKKVLKRGEYFGEESALFNRPSSFTAKTTQNTSLGFIPSETFMLNINDASGTFKKNCENLINSIN